MPKNKWYTIVFIDEKVDSRYASQLRRRSRRGGRRRNGRSGTQNDLPKKEKSFPHPGGGVWKEKEIAIQKFEAWKFRLENSLGKEATADIILKYQVKVCGPYPRRMDAEVTHCRARGSCFKDIFRRVAFIHDARIAKVARWSLRRVLIDRDRSPFFEFPEELKVVLDGKIVPDPKSVQSDDWGFWIVPERKEALFSDFFAELRPRRFTSQWEGERAVEGWLRLFADRCLEGPYRTIFDAEMQLANLQRVFSNFKISAYWSRQKTDECAPMVSVYVGARIWDSAVHSPVLNELESRIKR